MILDSLNIRDKTIPKKGQQRGTDMVRRFASETRVRLLGIVLRKVSLGATCVSERRAS